MRFADTTLLISAARDIYNALQRVTRIQSPPKNNTVARRNFYLYVDGKMVGSLPGAFSALRPDALDYRSVVRVVGPLVNYGRKAYWNPVGRSLVMNITARGSGTGKERFTYGSPFSPHFKPMRMRTIRKLANAQGGNKAENLKRLLGQRPGYVEGAGQIVKRVVRRDRRYASMYISDNWISYPPASFWGKRSKDDRVPSVSVQFSRKGGVRLL